MPYQRTSRSGRVNASKTRRQGASNTRVITISLSVGVVTTRERVALVSVIGCPSDRGCCVRGFLGLELVEQRVEAPVALVPGVR